MNGLKPHLIHFLCEITKKGSELRNFYIVFFANRIPFCIFVGSITHTHKHLNKL